MKSVNNQNQKNIDENQDDKDNGYIADKKIKIVDSPYKKILIAGAIAVGGYAAYRAGLLKPVISKAIEYASTHISKVDVGITQFKKWLQGTANNEENLKNSIVRQHNIKTMIEKAHHGETSLNEVIKDTKEDLEDLKKGIEYKTEEAKKALNNKYKKNEIINTDLIDELVKTNAIKNGYKSAEQRKSAEEILLNDIAENHVLKPSDAINQINRTGYRTATLGDIIAFKDNIPSLENMYASNSSFDIDGNEFKYLYNFLVKAKKDVNGKPMSLIQDGLFKNIILDKNILINEKGAIADLRNSSNMVKGLARSLAFDYNIPKIKANPLEMLNLYPEKKYNIGSISLDTINPVITNEKGEIKLKKFKEQFGGTHPFASYGKAYKFNKESKKFEAFMDDIELIKINKGDKAGTPQILRDLAKVADISTTKREKHSDTAAGKILDAISDTLDIGKQDVNNYNQNSTLPEKIREIFNPNTYFEKASNGIIAKLFGKPTEIRKLNDIFNDNDEIENYFILVKKRKKLSDILKNKNFEDIDEYIKQYFYGRKNLNKINTGSLGTFHMSERVNDILGAFGLALSSRSTGSAFDTIKNLVLKRFLPVYLGYQAFQYINYLSETKNDDDKDNPDNISKKGARLIAGLDIELHEAAETFGIPSLFKKIEQLTPGSDQISELPGLNVLKLSKNKEEIIKYYQTGMDPIRKGRYWGLGNTPYTGSKISYYRPNLYRRIMADADFSDTKYGSRKEYFENAWFPTPIAPLAPIRHFLTDKYHYEMKHYYDRPYMKTNPQLYNVPLIGPALYNTVGRVLKPVRKMHPEAWNDITQEDALKNTQKILNRHNADNIKYSPNSLTMRYGSEYNNKVIPKIPSISVPKYYSKDNIENKNTIETKYVSSKYESVGTEDNNLNKKGVLTTFGGSQNIIEFDGTTNSLSKINNALKKVSIKGIQGVNRYYQDLNEKPTSNFTIGFDLKNNKDNNTGSSSPLQPIQKPTPALNEYEKDVIFDTKNAFELKNMFIDEYSNVTEFLGMYGFMAKAFLIGDLGKNQIRLENSNNAFNFNNKFWNMEIGGLGGDTSEIYRRFIQQQNNSIKYLNPIRNTMPNWMPGENYFIDFKHGDPYTKIKNGELRLPGQAYERLWHIKEPLKMNIEANILTKSHDELINHFLHNDDIRESEKWKDEVNNRIHKSAMNKLIKSGLVLEINGQINDKANNIHSVYDLRMMKSLKSQEQVLMNIKVLSSDLYKKQKNRKIRDKDYNEMNYQLYATGLKKGYVTYIDKDHPNRSHITKVKYNKNRLEDSINKLNKAREEILNKIASGELSRSDLYSPLDKLRILADVAPYSNEFKLMQSKVSQKIKTKEEQEEFSEILNRVKEQKKPLRNYEYKFRYADTVKKKVKVSKIEGSKIFVNIDGKERSIHFAGIKNTDKQTAEIIRKGQKIKGRIKEGQKIYVEVDTDKLKRDQNKSLRAIVYDTHGHNINKELIRSGFSQYNDKDNTAPGIKIRFNAIERAIGANWEKIAHLDTFTNMKYLQARSAKEDYERRNVYGKNFQSWNNPISGFVIPNINMDIHKKTGLITAAMHGSEYGRTKFGKASGAILSMSGVALGKVYKNIYEHKNGKQWIPVRKRKENEINEYMDALKYIKNYRLYDKYKKKALKEDNFDVDKYEQAQKEEAEKRKKEVKGKNNVKEKLKENYEHKKEQRDKFDKEEKPTRQHPPLHFLFKNDNKKGLGKSLDEGINDVLGNIYDKQKEKFDNKSEIKHEDTKEAKKKITEINKNIDKLKSYRKVTTLPENAEKALYYKQQYKSTIRGYEPGDPVQNLLSALPKTEKDKMKYFLKAPKKERKEIIKMLPNYINIPLKHMWGIEDNKQQESLEKYFTKHKLPSTAWKGWNENYDLDNIKVKIINQQHLDQKDFNEWEENVTKANDTGKISIPNIDYRSNALDIRKRIMALMNNMGYKDVNISYTYKGNNMNIDMDLQHENSDKEQEETVKRMVKGQ